MINDRIGSTNQFMLQKKYQLIRRGAVSLCLCAGTNQWLAENMIGTFARLYEETRE